MAESPFGELRVNNVDPVVFIAGSQQYFNFDLFEADGITPFDVSGLSKIQLVIAPYNNPYLVVATINGEQDLRYINRLQFILSETATANLSGVYIHQLTITDGSGNVHKPTQGLITIIPKIGTTNIKEF